MGNLCSIKKNALDNTTRRFYIGKVPEIEAEPQRRWSGRKTTRDSLSNSSSRRRDEAVPIQTTVRRNSSVVSLSAKRRRRTSLRRLASAEPATTVERRKETFPDNYIKTSRYTILTFLPKNLYEQFRRFVNFYFLVVTLLQWVIDSPESPLSSTFGFLFVICVTAVKQGYEDWIRHRADDGVNKRKVDVITEGKFHKTRSKDLQVGDIVRLEEEDPLPADILVLSSSDEFHRCQITTANLDGESNLKIRYCPPGLPDLKTPFDVLNLNAVMECEQPNANLYSFNGNLLLLKRQFQEQESVRSKTSKGEEPSTSESLSRRLGAAIKDSIRSRLSVKIPEIEEEETQFSSEFLQIPITMENMLLRGTRLKNTDYIYGLVVYTGKDTRLAQNSRKTSTKFPTADKSINAFLFLIMAFVAVAVTVYSGLHFVWLRSDIIEGAWYLTPQENIGAIYVIEISFSFLVVFYYIIPISLYVTIELQTFFGSKFFVWDEEMRCPQTGIPPVCNTSDLNEELGQIEYLFSDKTGTLTENIMEFRHCSIDGVRYKYHQQLRKLQTHHDEKVVDISDKKFESVLNFMRTLALCHTVQVISAEQRKKRMSGSRRKLTSQKKKTDVTDLTKDDDHLEFQASSPDELALLESCAELGIRFLSDQNDVLTLDVYGQIESYKRHYILEFDADRKCMSVILENSQGEIWLLTKGAESTIFPNSVSGCKQKSNQHVDEFAQMGLRTLAVARKQLSREALDKFTEKLNKTQRLVQNREEKMRELYRSNENDLHVLGATGVEDQLQDGVPETLIALGQAGIRVWVLTGDKVETAVNVAVACGLLTQSSKQMRLTNFKTSDTLADYLETIKSEDQVNEDTTFIIDGESLAIAFNTCSELFCTVLMKAGRVVCCRLAPLQKAQVVSMVKSTKNKPKTAAVGDGANDVAMIQEAHIGLGIFGKEGRQAARSADFALARFSFLKKAILVHGHWYYVRLSTLVLYFFYKNVVLIFPPAFSSFHTAFSSQSLFNAFFMTFFNIFFTSAPILAFALQEQPVSATRLLENPEMYKTLSRNKLMSWKLFFVWILRAAWHSSLIYFFPYMSIPGVPQIADWPSFGVFIISLDVAIVNIMLLGHTSYFTGWNLFAFGCSYISFFAFTSIFTETDLLHPGVLRHTFFMVQSQLGFWLNVFIVTTLAMIPDILHQYVKRKYWRSTPNYKEALQDTRL